MKNNQNFLIKEKENITGPLQEEKKEVVAFVERQLNGLSLDYKWIAEENKVSLVAQIVTYYRLEVTNNHGWEKRYDFFSAKSGWLEKIKDAQNKADLKVIERCLGRVITAFGAKETPKFREITAKLNELETELKKNEVNQSRVSSLKNEIIPKFTRKTEGEYHDLDDFYFSPIVYTYFNKNLVKEIEKQNQKNTQPKNNDDVRFNYSSFQELEEGRHKIVRKYKELAAKIFDNYNDRKKRVVKKEYKNIDVQLSQEIVSGDWNLGNFWDTSNSYISESYRKQCEEKNQIELRNRKRLIEKMEQLIAKAEQGNNSDKKTVSGEEKGFEQLISEKVRQNSEKGESITNVLAAAKEENDPQKLANLLEQIRKANEGKDMEESEKNEIRKLKERMFDSNPQAKQETISKLNNLLSQSNLSKEENDKIAQELEDLNKEENKQEIIKKEESIAEKIGIASAQKKLNELVNKARNFLQSNLLNKFHEIKKEVVQFVAEQGYNNKAYLANKSEIDQLFAQTSSEQRPQEPTWKKAVVPISLLIATTAIVIIAAIVAKKRKEKTKIKVKQTF